METLVLALALVTIGSGLLLGVWNKIETDRMVHVRTEEKSSLAKDGPGPQPIRGA